MISYNSNEEFNRLQSEALQRVREMQMKANSFINPKNSPKNDENSQNKQNNTSQNVSSNQRSANNFNNDFFIKKNPDNKQQMNKQHIPEKDNKPSPQNNFQQNPSRNPRQNNRPQANINPPPKEAPPKPNPNMHRASNPFAQLFGSNLGGFNKYKNSSNPNNQGNEMINDISKGIGKFISDISIDEEKLLILLLIYILYKNGADIKLLIALLYLIL